MEQLWNYLFHVYPIFSNFTKITGLVQALSTSSFTAVQCSANFRIFQIFQIFANSAGFTKIVFLVGVFLTSPFTAFHWFSEFSNVLKMLQFLHCLQTWTYLSDCLRFASLWRALCLLNLPKRSTTWVKFYFGLSLHIFSLVRHCLWKMCATPGARINETGLLSSAAVVRQSESTELCSSAAVMPQSKSTELCSLVAVVPQSKSTELCSLAAVVPQTKSTELYSSAAALCSSAAVVPQLVAQRPMVYGLGSLIST